MTTSFLSEIISEFDEIPLEKRIYFRERLRHRLYDLIVGGFIKHRLANPNFTQVALARRIRNHPEVIDQWLSSPGDWTLDTVSDLLVGILGAELGISVDRLSDARTMQNTEHTTTPKAGDRVENMRARCEAVAREVEEKEEWPCDRVATRIADAIAELKTS